MVTGYAHITINGVTETLQLTALEMAGIVGERKGFSVIDAEPTGQGNNWRVKAYANAGPAVSTVTANGTSLTAAVSRLIESIW